MTFGAEYSDNMVHFIAGGRTRALIEQYEWDHEHADEILAGIAKEYGAQSAIGLKDEGSVLIFAKPVSNPLFVDPSPREYNGKGTVAYRVNLDLPEGQALADRLNDVPKWRLGFDMFAKRLTGSEKTLPNPDRLRSLSGESDRFYDTDYGTDAAIFRKYGDTYVVSVPRVLRGIFNDAAAKLSSENGVKISAGHTYEWFTPPDSQQIPYSQVIALQEAQKGDQLKAQVSTRPVMSARPRR